MWSSVKHSGPVYAVANTDCDIKSQSDCVCRGEIQLNYDSLWITVVYYRIIMNNSTNHSTAHASGIQKSLSNMHIIYRVTSLKLSNYYSEFSTVA